LSGRVRPGIEDPTEDPGIYNFGFFTSDRSGGFSMPIYAYRCSSCGHAKDVLQKVSDPLLSVCPACGAEAFQKQITAAGFQLKGSGWYVTDFRGGSNGGGAKPDGGASKPDGGASKPDTASDGGSSGGQGDAAAASSETKTASAAGGCGTSCACH
jgi:putative FmdB family regulatory protein